MRQAPPEPGWFVAIVGPSGAGKDTILRGAQAILADKNTFSFPQRTITRPDGDENEDHIAISTDDFLAARDAGQFCVSWSAHGLHYGIPQSAQDDVTKGRVVAANVSRAVLENIRNVFARVHVIQISVERDILAERLRKRGRESEGEIQSRLLRADSCGIEGPDVVALDNSGDSAVAIAALVDILESLARGAGDQSIDQV